MKSEEEKKPQEMVELDTRQLKSGDLESMKVSDILKGEFAAIEIPMIEIPGSTPLICNEPEALLAEIAEKDEFMVDNEEEEFLMFTAEIIDFWAVAQDGPFQTLRWRQKVRSYYRDGPIIKEKQAEEETKIISTSGSESQMKSVAEINMTLEETQMTEGAVAGDHFIIYELTGVDSQELL